MPHDGVLIGCGFFAQNHLHAWAAQPEARIVAVCDSDPARAQATAERFGIAHHYSDAAQALALHRPGFVDIVTTSASHRPLVELAVGHAPLVICQKPFADSYADGSAMVAAARDAGSTLLVHENFRWQRPYRRMAGLLRAGVIGTPRFARISFRHGFDNYGNQPYLAEIERFALMDMGLHLFDLARVLVGEVDRVTCVTQRRNPRVRGEDAFTALLAHRDGAASVVDCSYDSVIRPEPFPQTSAWIEGDRGTLELSADYRLTRHLPTGAESHDEEPPVPAWGARPWHGIQDSVVAFCAHAVSVMQGRAEGQPTGAHNLRTLAMALACYDSAASGRSIAIDDWIGAQG